MPRPNRKSLWDLIAASRLPANRCIADAGGHVALQDLQAGSTLDVDAETLRGRSILVSSARQLPAALAFAQLDGLAGRILLCPPDLDPAYIPAILAEAEVDTVVTDGTGPACATTHTARVIHCTDQVRPVAAAPHRDTETEWLLFTSGTTGRPKLVVHTLQSLTGPLDDGLAVASDAIWSTFYDVRRYGGLQILLRAFLGGGSMVLSQAGELVGDFLARAGAAGVTHISGTPSHWRRALMSPAAERLSPGYVRLSGEIADQAILNSLKAKFPAADVAHAFASTEAGVAFDVRDGLAGFPAVLIDNPATKADMRVIDGSLRIRSTRTAQRYFGTDANPLAGDDGFVDTGDMVELRDGRYYFVGRREGVINVGGQKVHPEEVEAVINQHPRVQMSRVRGRKSPITGALVTADLVLRPAETNAAPFATIREEILASCRAALPAHKIPVTLREVASLEIAASGKLVRTDA